MISDEQRSAIRLSIKRSGKGLCIDCGVPVPHLKGKWPRCLKCMRNHYKYSRTAKCKKRKNERLRERIASGRCACGGSLAPFRKKCGKCLLKNAASAARSKRKRRLQNTLKKRSA